MFNLCESQGDGGISGLFWGHFKKLKAEKFAYEKIKAMLTEKLNVSEAFDVLAR